VLKQTGTVELSVYNAEVKCDNILDFNTQSVSFSVDDKIGSITIVDKQIVISLNEENVVN
jgi:hypothetical protein